MILMIVEFIQIQKNNNLSTGLQDLGRIFLGFLDYYGKQEHKTIITADIPGIVITKMEMDHFMLVSILIINRTITFPNYL